MSKFTQQAASSNNQRQTPPVEFLRTGRVSEAAVPFVRYVDQDVDGNNVLIENVPQRPCSSRIYE